MHTSLLNSHIILVGVRLLMLLRFIVHSSFVRKRLLIVRNMWFNQTLTVLVPKCHNPVHVVSIVHDIT